jgi:phosphoribosyl 1,2-cyclic phosphodiesterase
MKVKVWGCRGSITTPGPATVRYGGNSTCLEIRSSEGQVFIVDAGSGLRNFGKALRQEQNVSDVRFFLTHPHWDHLAGFPFFEPAYSDRYNITFCSGPHAQNAIRKYLSRQMEAPYFPIEFSCLKANFSYNCRQPKSGSGNCRIGSMEFRAFPLNHPGGGYGFKFIENGRTFVFLSDNELGFPHAGGLASGEYADICRDADLLFHDAQYTSQEYQYTRGWGHSTYEDATRLAIDAGVKRFGLFHHDPDRDDDDLERQADYCRRLISQAGSRVECFPCSEGTVFEL